MDRQTVIDSDSEFARWFVILDVRDFSLQKCFSIQRPLSNLEEKM